MYANQHVWERPCILYRLPMYMIVRRHTFARIQFTQHIVTLRINQRAKPERRLGQNSVDTAQRDVTATVTYGRSLTRASPIVVGQWLALRPGQHSFYALHGRITRRHQHAVTDRIRHEQVTTREETTHGLGHDTDSHAN